MARIGNWLKRIFIPPAGSGWTRRTLPYMLVMMVVLVAAVGMTFAWEYTNSTEFCGLTCHTMPPEYVTHSNSIHTRLTCEDCHLGRAPLGTQIIRKIDYGQGTFFAMVFNTYEYPIIATKMRPARDVCETCHYPEVFSADAVFEIKQFAEDEANTPSTTYLILKTGGGTSREGLGRGIHWHIENPVYFLATDIERQNIPYIRVQNPDGTLAEYVDVESGFDLSSVNDEDLQVMDCISCHNRTAHAIAYPEDALNQLMGNGLISTRIPEIRKKGAEVLKVNYSTAEEALSAIEGLNQYYQSAYPDFYASDSDLIDQAVASIKDTYQKSVFIDQKYNWDSHPNNTQHKNSAGCFRCHDGKHLNSSGEAIRLECNICHSIPEVASAANLVANIQVNRGFEPETHKNSNWITIHRDVFDETCAGCHTIEDPGGVSDTSFCSNSACHGNVWTYAGFDAPKLKELLMEQIKEMVKETSVPTAQPTSTPRPRSTQIPDELTELTPNGASITAAPLDTGRLIYEADIAPLLQGCITCHSENGAKGVNLISYDAIMAGSPQGALVIPGNPEDSLLLIAQSRDKPHFQQLSSSDLEKVRQWIKAGSPQN